MPLALRQWRYWTTRALRPATEPSGVPSALERWEAETTPGVERLARALAGRVSRPARAVLLASSALIVGAGIATPREQVGPAHPDWSYRVAELERTVAAQRGELELARIELDRFRMVSANSSRYRIPADLAASIHDIALAEGIDPGLAFRLVLVESGFSASAVSHKGAVGLTQVMPSTAADLVPGIPYRALFDPETNLRLGFRYLSYLIERYDGDLRIALLAYNRGPGTVDAIRREGGDPANGYARAILGTRRAAGTRPITSGGSP